MGQQLYWHAPLWEVLLVGLLSLVFLGWLLVLALRRPDLSATLTAINPALNDQPLFYLDRLKGITGLNDAARNLLDSLRESQQQFLRDVLVETMLEAYEEARITRQEGWPDADSLLIAVPVFRQPSSVIGVLALVTMKAPLARADRPVDEHLALELQAWLTLGPALQLHRTRPVVHVRRIHSTTADNGTPTWQEYPLSYSEEILLRYLVEHQGEVQTAETLFHVIWPEDEVDRYGLRPDQKDRLRRLVYQLRQHVESDPCNPRHVCTVHGVGYVLHLE